MRILSARITRARRDRLTGRVEAIVSLTALRGDGVEHVRVRVAVSARAEGAASLRDRLLGAAKLGLAAAVSRDPARRAA